MKPYLQFAIVVLPTSFLFACSSSSSSSPSAGAPADDPDGPQDGANDTAPGRSDDDNDGGTSTSAPKNVDPLAGLTLRDVGAASTDIQYLMAYEGNVAVFSSKPQSGNYCESRDLSIATSAVNSVRAVAPTGYWLWTITSDGHWLVLDGLPATAGACPTISNLSSKVLDLTSASATPRAVASGPAYAAGNTLVVVSASMVRTESPSGAAGWTMNAALGADDLLEYRLLSDDGRRVRVKRASDAAVVDVASGKTLSTATGDVEFLTADGSYLRVLSAPYNTTPIIGPGGVQTTIPGSYVDVSRDGKRLLWRDSASSGPLTVRTLGTNGDVQLGSGNSQSYFTEDGDWVHLLDSYYSAKGGPRVAIGRDGETVAKWAATADHSAVFYSYTTGSSSADVYALRTSAGTTTVAMPKSPEYLFPRALSGLPNPSFVAASSAMFGHTPINDRIYLVTTTAGKPNPPIELWKLSSVIGTGQIVGWQDGILYYRANDELRAITGDGKYKQTFGPAKMVALAGAPFTGIFVADGKKVSFLAPGKYKP